MSKLLNTLLGHDLLIALSLNRRALYVHTRGYIAVARVVLEFCEEAGDP